MIKPKNESAHVRQLIELFDQGKEQARWTDRSDCARSIGIPPEEFRCALNGYRSDKKVIETIAFVRQAVAANTISVSATPPVHAHKEESNEMFQLFERGVEQGLWKGKSDCARIIGTTRSKLCRYIQEPGLRTLDGFQRVLRKLRKGATEGVRAPSEHPMSQKTVPAGSFGKGFAAFQELIRTLVQEELQSKRAGSPASSDIADTPPEGVVKSTWASEVIAGRMELAGQSVPGVRFALTAPPFKEIMNRFTSEELQDTKEFIQIMCIGLIELLRRFTIASQLHDPDIRAENYRVLGPLLDALTGEIERLGHVDLCATWKLIQQQRDEMAQLRGETPDTSETSSHHDL